MVSPAENVFLFQWIWEGDTQLAADQYVNSWHFQAEILLGADFENVRDMLIDFYTGEADGQSNPIIDFMTNTSVTGKYTIKAYSLDDPKPRYPVYEFTDTAAIGSGTALPTENAVVFSFSARREAGEKQARRRNRIYLGPFAESANDDGMVEGALVENLLFAGKGLFNAAESALNWSWKVYSPTDDNEMPVYSGWVDNGWDTQRRRGRTATARGTFDGDQPT